MSDPVPRAERRYEEGRTRRRTWWLLLAALAIIVALGLAYWYAQPDLIGSSTAATPESRAAQSTAPHVSKACADALALADLLASHVGPLAQAANDHVDVMERLDLFLEGKPGGLDGHQAYMRGEAQMRVMEEHGPDAEVQTKRYKEVRKGCTTR